MARSLEPDHEQRNRSYEKDHRRAGAGYQRDPHPAAGCDVQRRIIARYTAPAGAGPTTIPITVVNIEWIQAATDMTSAAPRVTVFTPFYTDIHFLDDTINSVLSQSFTDFEYLLVNDGPQENSDAIVGRFSDARIRIITPGTRIGLNASRNLGLQEARGELIAFIDSDDLCEPGRLAKQVAFLDSHLDHVLVGSALRLIDEHGRTIGHRSYAEDDEQIANTIVVLNCIAQPAAMARRAALIQAGGYTETFVAEDYDLWLRMKRLGRFHNLREPLTAYRIHDAARKNVRLRPTLRDTTRLKIHAVRHYGYRLTPRVALSIAAHLALQLLPDRVIFWLFRRLFTSS